MNIKDVIKAVNYQDNGKIHQRFEKEREKLNRLQSLTYILEAISNLAYKVKEYQDSKLNYEICENKDYPQEGIDLCYEVEGQSGRVTISPIYLNQYSVIDFLESIKDNQMEDGLYGELVIDSMFKFDLSKQILGEEILEEYLEKAADLGFYW